MNEKSEVNFFQELSTNAWAPIKLVLYNGWYLRIAEGITKRANSALPINYTGIDCSRDIDIVEGIYAKNKLPIIFQLPDLYEPQNLSDVLLSKGFKTKDESLVMTVDLSKIILPQKNTDYEYIEQDEVTVEWLTALKQINNQSNERINGVKAIIERSTSEQVFFTCLHKDRIVGVCLAVIERGYLGLYNMAVDESFRRKGIAQSLFVEMYRYAKEKSLEGFYLQVQGDNKGAINLYQKVGFTEIYKYVYYVKP